MHAHVRLSRRSLNNRFAVCFGWPLLVFICMLSLADFFKHGFDGSGDDGGSCIDGRLTSAWNWCSKIEKKRYYKIFLLAGFQSFDGKWHE
jgi:hypothetical protein